MCRLVATLSVFSVVFLSPLPASGQDLRKVFDDPLVATLNTILDEWERGELVFPAKQELQEQFHENLSRRVKERPAGYEDEKWRGTLLRNWEMLPDRLMPEVRLTDGARLAILAGFVDNLGELRARLKPEKTRVFDATKASLFAVLAWAQREASQRNDRTISSAYVQRSLNAFFTGVYPFCRIERPARR